MVEVTALPRTILDRTPVGVLVGNEWLAIVGAASPKDQRTQTQTLKEFVKNALTAADVIFVPITGISAVNVQAAIAELQAEKLSRVASDYSASTIGSTRSMIGSDPSVSPLALMHIRSIAAESGGNANILMQGEISSIIIQELINATTSGPQWNLIHRRGTLAIPTVSQVNDILFRIGGFGYDGSADREAFRMIGSLISAVPAAGDFAMRLVYNLVPNASGALTEFMRWEQSTGVSMYGANVVLNQNRHFRLRQYAAASLPSQNSGDMIASSDVVAAPLVSDGSRWLSGGVIVARANNANTTISVPAGWALTGDIMFNNTTANAVTGGVKIGTTSGAVDVVAAQAVGANAIGHITDATTLKRFFSISAAQTLFIQAVTAWNSAVVDLSFPLRKVM